MEYKTYYYTEGNVVRKQEQAVPAYEPQKKPAERKRRQAPAARPVRRQAALPIAPCLMIVAATMLALCVCINFLQVRAELLEHKRKIAALEAEWQTIRQENDIAQSRLDTVADLDDVYKKATTELGMVYPSTDRLIGYNSVESEYVRQYEEIPGE